MKKHKPFLTRFSREPYDHRSVNQQEQAAVRPTTPQSLATIFTKVRRETTDDN